MKRHVLKKLMAPAFLAVLLTLALCFAPTPALAASSLSISDGAPAVGDSFTATVYYSGTSFGSTDGVFSYDASILSFDGCSTECGGGGGEVRYSYYQTSGDDSMAVSFYFTVIGTGDGYLSVSADSYDYDGNYYEAESCGTSISVSSAEPEEEPEDEPEEEAQEEETTEKEEETENEEEKEEEKTDEEKEEEEKKEDEEEKEEEEQENDLPLFRIDDTDYVVLTPTSAPVGFMASSLKDSGQELPCLTSADGSFTLLRLAEASDPENAHLFLFDAKNGALREASFVETGGKTYLDVTNSRKLLYAGEEASPYRLYDATADSLQALSDNEKLKTALEEAELAKKELESVKISLSETEEKLTKAEQEALEAKDAAIRAATAAQTAEKTPYLKLFLGVLLALLLVVVILQVLILRKRKDE